MMHRFERTARYRGAACDPRLPEYAVGLMAAIGTFDMAAAAVPSF
jgi:hypothetical protein